MGGKKGCAQDTHKGVGRAVRSTTRTGATNNKEEPFKRTWEVTAVSAEYINNGSMRGDYQTAVSSSGAVNIEYQVIQTLI